MKTIDMDSECRRSFLEHSGRAGWKAIETSWSHSYCFKTFGQILKGSERFVLRTKKSGAPQQSFVLICQLSIFLIHDLILPNIHHPIFLSSQSHTIETNMQTMAFSLPPPLPASPQRRSRTCRRRTPHASTPNPASPPPTLPASYDEIRLRAANAVAQACTAKVPLQELQFPSVSNIATAALNELLDANRAHARTLLTRLRTTLAPRTLTALFPDSGETALAARAWHNESPSPIAALDAPPPSLDIALVVNPGFNVSEWFALEALQAPVVIALNADLDRVRSGYYPRIFYPRLYDTRTRFLSGFQEVFYLKNLADGGTLLREFPGEWTLFYRPLPKGRTDPPPPPTVLWTGSERPEFKEVLARLKAARTEDQLRRQTLRK